MTRRGFVDVAAGQVHYRHAGDGASSRMPIVLFHPSPGSSLMLQPLLEAFGASRLAIAIDTLGNGDSSAPSGEAPSLDVFVDAHIEALDALGLTRMDLYGGHTGGNIAAEIAIRVPDRVNKLILDGMSLYSDAERADMLRHYAPKVQIAADGTHLLGVWNFVRDAYLFWPWYKRDAQHRRAIGLPSPDALHDKAVEVIKAARTYHLSYRAAIAYRKEERLPMVHVPTLLACATTDMLVAYLDRVAVLMPDAIRAVTPGFGDETTSRATMAQMLDFLDGEVAA
jgi:pimeloyl-ACP methyl ester carboxylesterase